MVGSTSARRAPGSTAASSLSAFALAELLVGCVLLGSAALGGLRFAHRPWPTSVDSTGFRLLPANASAGWASDLAHLGSTPVFIAGVVCLGVIALLTQDRTRLLVCAGGPVAAVLVAELVAKPLVDRHFEGVISYPSGTVTAVAALAAAALVIAPQRTKVPVALAGVIAVASVGVAVVALRWHYPTDALGGACIGIGTVFTLDGALRRSASPASFDR